MSFTLSKEVNSDKVFLVRFSKLTEKRLDPNYQHLFEKFLEEIHKSPFPIERLKDSISYLQYGTSERATEKPVGTAVLRMANMQKDEWDLKKLKYLQVSQKEKEHYLLKNGDLLFNRTNSKELVGKCTEFDLDGEYIFASYLIRVRLNTKKLLPQYVTAFLSSNLGRMQIDAVSRQIAGMTNVNAEEIKDLLIPVPNLTLQRLIVKKMKDAFIFKHKKEQEAEKLLGSIDDYLLKELEIELHDEEDNCVDGRMFTRQFNEMSGQRFDPNFYKPEFYRRVKSITNGDFIKIGSIAFFRNETWDGDSFWDNEFPYIEIGEIDIPFGKIRKISYILKTKAPSRAKMVVHKGDVLVSLTRPSRGAITQYLEDESVIASTGFCVIKSVDENEVSKRFLYHLLRSKIILEQFEQRSSGGNYPAITMEEVKNTLLPLPQQKSQQVEISKHIDGIYFKAEQLKREADSILKIAKAEVERMILGEV
jgi:restriction endonuclease S subunit